MSTAGPGGAAPGGAEPGLARHAGPAEGPGGQTVRDRGAQAGHHQGGGAVRADAGHSGPAQVYRGAGQGGEAATRGGGAGDPHQGSQVEVSN